MYWNLSPDLDSDMVEGQICHQYRKLYFWYKLKNGWSVVLYSSWNAVNVCGLFSFSWRVNLTKMWLPSLWLRKRNSSHLQFLTSSHSDIKKREENVHGAGQAHFAWWKSMIRWRLLFRKHNRYVVLFLTLVCSYNITQKFQAVRLLTAINCKDAEKADVRQLSFSKSDSFNLRRFDFSNTWPLVQRRYYSRSGLNKVTTVVCRNFHVVIIAGQDKTLLERERNTSGNTKFQWLNLIGMSATVEQTCKKCVSL